MHGSGICCKTNVCSIAIPACTKCCMPPSPNCAIRIHCERTQAICSLGRRIVSAQRNALNAQHATWPAHCCYQRRGGRTIGVVLPILIPPAPAVQPIPTCGIRNAASSGCPRRNRGELNRGGHNRRREGAHKSRGHAATVPILTIAPGHKRAIS